MQRRFGGCSEHGFVPAEGEEQHQCDPDRDAIDHQCLLLG